MSPETEALARQLAAHSEFRWMPGMEGLFEDGRNRTIETVRVMEVDDRVVVYWPNGSIIRIDPVRFGMIPDIDDPATQGCLLAMLAKATDGRPLAVRRIGRSGVWLVYIDAPSGADTLGASLAAALLAAWGEP